MNWKKVAYAVAPVLLAGGLYLSGSDVLAKTVTKVITTAIAANDDVKDILRGIETAEEWTDSSYIYKRTLITGDGYALDKIYGYFKYEKTETQTETITEVPDDPIITEKTVPVAEPVSEPVVEAVPACEHSFSWVEEQEATATEDAIYVNRCSNCGIVIGSRREPGTAAGKFQQEIQEKISSAVSAIEAGGNGSAGTKTVVIDTGIWTCFNQKVLDELAKHPNVSLEIHYSYKNVRYVLMIPAGADLEAIRREDGFYGFRYLDSIFGGYQE